MLRLVSLRNPVHAMDSNQPTTQRRRSERISESIPLIVRGIDLLGQPFEERTSTLAINLNGCRYSSKHHLPRNSWVTLEVPRSGEMRNVRARVAWIQRPHSVREFFQIGVELESPANIWGLDSAPESWRDAAPLPGQESPWATKETIMSDLTNPSGDFESAPSTYAAEPAPEPGNPLLHDWKAEIEREANRAAESAAAQAGDRIRTAIEDLEGFSSGSAPSRMNSSARFERNSREAWRKRASCCTNLRQKAASLRAESEAAAESASRMAQARLQIEAAEAALASKPNNGAAQQEAPGGEEVARNCARASNPKWRPRRHNGTNSCSSRSTIASSVWRGSLPDAPKKFCAAPSRRLPAGLRAQRSSGAIDERSAPDSFGPAIGPRGGNRTSARFPFRDRTLREPPQGLCRSARSGEPRHLNELHRRLENILEAQTDEMRQRVERHRERCAGTPRPGARRPGQQFAERTIADVQSKVAPHVERVPELLRELSARELQAEWSLGLYRERLRQVSGNQSARGILAACVDSRRSAQ